MDLHALADFHLVATHGGFGRASRASGQPKATLSRRVRDLEKSLGVRLIERGSRTLRLTDEGVALHTRTGSPMGEIAEALQDVKAGLGRPGGCLRVSVPLLFAQTSLGALAAAFLAAYPEVLLEVATDDRFVDLVADEVDVVIRVNPRPDSELVGRCFLRNRLMLVAPPSLPQPPADAQPDRPDRFPAVMRTGTSSPIRITRGEDFQSLNVRGLYPAGEGASYAGGILSAGVDGIKVAEAVARAVLQQAEGSRVPA